MIQDFYEGFEIVELVEVQDVRGNVSREKAVIGLGVGAFNNKGASQVIVADKLENSYGVDLVCEVNEKITFGTLVFRNKTRETFKVINKEGVNNAPRKAFHMKDLAVYTCEKIGG